mmetsp:Transcript_20744/g.53892  ORF Transcript_20744/g.53892 Transcript_20744/m.53892 type:complete len:253 (+) Transcript_20744:905-1663(+)
MRRAPRSKLVGLQHTNLLRTKACETRVTAVDTNARVHRRVRRTVTEGARVGGAVADAARPRTARSTAAAAVLVGVSCWARRAIRRESATEARRVAVRAKPPCRVRCVHRPSNTIGILVRVALHVKHGWIRVRAVALVAGLHVLRRPGGAGETGPTVAKHTTGALAAHIFEKNNIRTISALLALAVIVVRVRVGPSPLKVNAVSPRHLEDVRDKVVLRARKSLHNIPPLATNVQSVNAPAALASAFLDGSERM